MQDLRAFWLQRAFVQKRKEGRERKRKERRRGASPSLLHCLPRTPADICRRMLMWLGRSSAMELICVIVPGHARDDSTSRLPSIVCEFVFPWRDAL